MTTQKALFGQMRQPVDVVPWGFSIACQIGKEPVEFEDVRSARLGTIIAAPRDTPDSVG